MDASVFVYITIFATVVSVAAAVAAAFISRSGGTSKLEGDVNELAVLVERLSRESRRERMRAVRAGQKAPAEAPDAFDRPPGLLDPSQPTETAPIDRLELKRRVMASRRINS